MKLKDTLRNNIYKILELTSSFEQQIEYKKKVPIANIHSEIICMWFDDTYLPNDKTFKEAFTSDELSKLIEFNKFYDLKVKNNPYGCDVTILHKNDDWILISQKANEILSYIFKGW